MSKIIVTGGCGYIGSHTCIALLTQGYKVVVFDDLSNASKESIERIEKIAGKRPELCIVDLKNKNATSAAFEAHKEALAVIHFAAYKAVKESVDRPLQYYENNFFSLINTLTAQQKLGINNFIFSSSATVYGMPETCPVTEKSPVSKPFSPYGNTKKIAEEILKDHTAANLDFSVISLRYFNPIGAHESGEIGELPNDIPNNLMPYITQTAAGIREKLMVFGNDYPTKDGTAIRDYIHVMDLAEAHVVAVNRLVDQKQEQNFEIYNLGRGMGYSVLEVITAFETQNNLSINYEITGRRDGDVPVVFASTELASKKLGWTAKRDLNSMVKSAWNWEKNYRKND